MSVILGRFRHILALPNVSRFTSTHWAQINDHYAGHMDCGSDVPKEAYGEIMNIPASKKQSEQ